MSITSPEQLEKVKACGRIVARALRAMPAAVRPGVTTAELSAIGAKVLALTVEPIIAAGTGRVTLDTDKWAVRTCDGSLAAHYEHTPVITQDEPIVLTAA